MAKKWIAAVIFAAFTMSTGFALRAQTVLTGAGSTFVNPIMLRWIADFHAAHGNINVNYQSVGSGAGIEQVKNQTVDFGASDAALTQDQASSMAPALQIPESAGPVCITYNLPGLKQALRLSADTLAGIYLGQITNWNDGRLAKDNPGMSLPNEPVIVVHRSDGSGTSNILTNYLAAVSPDWKSRVGAGLSVQWPVGLGGKGSEGVTNIVRQSAGSIGYVELTYATANHLPVVSMRNRDGQYVPPSTASASAAIAADAQQIAQDVTKPIVDASGARSYPITGLTFLIVPRDGSDVTKRQALKEFIEFIIAPAQQRSAANLNYAPLPSSLQQHDKQLLGEMTANGKPLR